MENCAYVKQMVGHKGSPQDAPRAGKGFQLLCTAAIGNKSCQCKFLGASLFGLFWGVFGRILVLLWPQKEVLSVRLEVLCIAGWLTDGIYHTHCAHECHRLPHGVLHATTRASAFNCRQLQTVDIY